MTGANLKSFKWTLQRKIIAAIVLLAFVPIVIIMPGLFWELHEANSVLRHFGDALVTRQYRSAYDDFTSKEFQASVDFQTFTKVHQELVLKMGDLKNVEITQNDIKDRSDGWYGTAETTMNFARGSMTFIFILRKTGSHWKIYSYHEE